MPPDASARAQLELDLRELLEVVERARDAQRDRWWRPTGREQIRRNFAGTELRNICAIAHRKIVDVPLPDVCTHPASEDTIASL